MTIQNKIKRFAITSISLSLIGVAQNTLATSVECGAGSNISCVLPTGGTTASSGPSNRTDTRAYAGLSWSLDGSNGYIPDFLVGARSLNVNSYSQVSGADFNVRVRYKESFSFDSIRLAYVGGTRGLMGNAGLGYSFSGNSVLVTAAAQAAYSRLGADYSLTDNGIKPYLEANSLYMPKSVASPSQTTASCNSPYKLTSASSVTPPFSGVSSTAALNGQTCYVPPI